MRAPVDYQTLLDNWSVTEEQNRADFIDFLYVLYERKDGLYTGLWQQFCNDTSVFLRNSIKTNLIVTQFAAMNLKFNQI
jgi:hypothetical protein